MFCCKYYSHIVDNNIVHYSYSLLTLFNIVDNYMNNVDSKNIVQSYYIANVTLFVGVSEKSLPT